MDMSFFYTYVFFIRFTGNPIYSCEIRKCESGTPAAASLFELNLPFTLMLKLWSLI